jgi:hypothetical protein
MEQDLERSFTNEMFGIYMRAKSEANYNATVFYRMLHDKGGIETARYLINAAKPSDGYTALYEKGRLDLTVEAMLVQNEKWHPLFLPDEILRARKRLEAYGYQIT